MHFLQQIQTISVICVYTILMCAILINRDLETFEAFLKFLFCIRMNVPIPQFTCEIQSTTCNGYLSPYNTCLLKRFV